MSQSPTLPRPATVQSPTLPRPATVFRLLHGHEVAAFVHALVYTGGALDAADGYLHLAPPVEVAPAAARFFPGDTDLHLLEVGVASLPAGAVRWETLTPGGIEFPHLHAPLPWAAVISSHGPLPLGSDGAHVLPSCVASACAAQAAAAAAVAPPFSTPLRVPSTLITSAYALPAPVSVTLLLSEGAPVTLVWSPEDCVRLRKIGRIAASAVGMCSSKVATNGKSAAVPLALGDEELYVATALGWLVVAPGSAPSLPTLAAALDLSLALSPDRDSAVRRRVAYCDLWGRGYRLTPGIKFGVHYLAYKADPSVIHADFMVNVLAEGDETAPLDLIARSRVATTALKVAVFAYVDLRGGEGDAPCPTVRYQAFKRMGPGQANFELMTSAVVDDPLGAGDAVELVAAGPTSKEAAAAAAEAAKAAVSEGTEGGGEGVDVAVGTKRGREE